VGRPSRGAGNAAAGSCRVGPVGTWATASGSTDFATHTRPAAASSIASFASRSAYVLRSRGIQSNVTDGSAATSARPSACSGCRSGCFTRQRPDICSTTSFESIRTATEAGSNSAAARSPASSPLYSATLLVVRPSDAARSASTSPDSASRTTAP